MGVWDFDFVAEDFSYRNQVEIYNQMRERANTRLKRARSRNDVIFANRALDQFLGNRGRRYFPKASSLSERELESYLNQMLSYLNDRTSTKSGVDQVLQERLNVFNRRDEFGNSLLGGTWTRDPGGSSRISARELDMLLRSEEWQLLKKQYEYHLLLEDFSKEIERGRSAADVLADWRDFIDNSSLNWDQYMQRHDDEYLIKLKIEADNELESIIGRYGEDSEEVEKAREMLDMRIKTFEEEIRKGNM